MSNDSDILIFEHEFPIERCPGCGAELIVNGGPERCLGNCELSDDSDLGEFDGELDFSFDSAERVYEPDTLVTGAYDEESD
jgi:hypothetical protein